MDNLTDNEIKEYLSGLSDAVLDLVQDKTWGKRVDEIAEKYSLNEEQSTVLTNLTLFVLIGVEAPETLEGAIMMELGISQLLTEQIMKDLDTRVFQYAVDFIEKQNGPSLPLPNVSRLDLDTKTEVVEIPPVILPLVESQEQREKMMAKIPDNLPGVEIKQVSKAIFDTPNQSPAMQENRFVGAEFAQKPIDVPRFNVAGAPEPSIPPKPQNVVEQKPEIQNPPRYTSDPYREPLQ